MTQHILLVVQVAVLNVHLAICGTDQARESQGVQSQEFTGKQFVAKCDGKRSLEVSSTKVISLIEPAHGHSRLTLHSQMSSLCDAEIES